MESKDATVEDYFQAMENENRTMDIGGGEKGDVWME